VTEHSAPWAGRHRNRLPVRPRRRAARAVIRLRDASASAAAAPAQAEIRRAAQWAAQQTARHAAASEVPRALRPSWRRAGIELLAMPPLAVLAAASLFLPVAPAFGLSLGLLGSQAGVEGAFLMLLFALTLAAALGAVALAASGDAPATAERARIAAGLLGVVSGLFGAVDGIVIGRLGGYAPQGAGVVLLTIMSLALVTVSALALLSPRTPHRADPPSGGSRAR